MNGNMPFYTNNFNNNTPFNSGNGPSYSNNCPNGNCQRMDMGSRRSCCPGGFCCPNGRCTRDQTLRQPSWHTNNGRRQ